MLNNIVDSLQGSKVEGLANTFRRLGRLGFWMQVVLGSFPVVLMLYIFLFTGSLSVSGTRAGLPLVEYLTVLNLLVLLFTTLWFYLLAAPQGGIPAIQTTPGTTGGAASWVSTVDVASLMALLLTLTAEVVALVLGLWLLFRTSQTAEAFPEAEQT